jgi:hypothetical protein
VSRRPLERAGAVRDIQPADLEVFFERQRDPEAVQRSMVPPRERERYMTHRTTRVLGDPTVLVQTVTLDGEHILLVLRDDGLGRDQPV